MASATSDESESNTVRNKPRLSTFERKQLKKKISGSLSNNEKAAEINNQRGVETVTTVPPPPIVSETAVPVNTADMVDKRLSSLLPDLTRQLSEASNHVAKRCVSSSTEEASRIQKYVISLNII